MRRRRQSVVFLVIFAGARHAPRDFLEIHAGGLLADQSFNEGDALTYR